MFSIALVALLIFPLIYSQEISIKNVDFDVEQFTEHKTVKFYGEEDGYSKVIVRRGGELKFTVELSDNWNGEKIRAILNFESRFDKLTIPLPFGGNFNGWRLTQKNGKDKIEASIFIPANAQVGVWELTVVLTNSKGRVIEKHTSTNEIVVLFNPWSKDDAAYFPDQEKLDEYLLNENGLMYSFDYTKISRSLWIYGQFQSKVLDAVLLALSKTRLRAKDRGNIVLVARELTNMMNDDHGHNRGVLQGRWKEPYDKIDGHSATRPWDWTGSPAIFLEYLENNGRTVGFGQCWVFAGILTTAYRALGIASRPVSNLLSAHSKKRDLTVDVYLDEEGEIASQDLVWNYHAWTQAWFSRENDLGQRYSGWQELDATPQERTMGRYLIGPTSSYALSISNLTENYDTAFLYEAVNCDEVVYSADKKIQSIDRTKIGLAVVTKPYGSYGLDVITRLYKPEEDTKEERVSYIAAAKSLGLKPPSLDFVESRSSKNDVIINIQTPEQMKLGSPVPVKIILKNPSYSFKYLNISLKATSIYYNGETGDVLKRNKIPIKLSGSKPAEIQFNIKPEDYIGKLHDQYTIRVETAVSNGRVVAFKKQLFSLRTPELIVSPLPPVRVNQTFPMTIKVKNPFNQTLTGCYVAIEGTRIKRKVVKVQDIAAASIKTFQLQLKSRYSLKEKIVVKFSAKNMKMQSSVDLEVSGKPLYQFASCKSKRVNRLDNSEVGNSRILKNHDYKNCNLKPIN